MDSIAASRAAPPKFPFGHIAATWVQRGIAFIVACPSKLLTCPRNVFTLDHPAFMCEPMVVDLGQDHFWITGGIKTLDGRDAGSFVRRLVRRGFEWVAVHENFAVKREFRRRGIAYAHYRKALRAYRELGCHRVEMFAQDFGPFVWPQFGFRYRWAEDQRDVAAELDRLHRAKTGAAISFVPDREWEMVLFALSSGELIGAAAAMQTARDHPNGALEMVLDLRDRHSLELLVSRGIFGPEEM